MYSLLMSRANVYNARMKQETVITIRVTPEIKAVIQRLADEDDRTLAWMARKLIIEALESRGLIETEKKR